jgi:hypothetical protein
MRFFRSRELLGLMLVASLGCEVANVDVVRHGTATIPKDGAFEVMRFDGFELTLGEIHDEMGIERKDVSDATLEQLTLEVLSPDGADLSFIDRIEVFAESDELGRVRVAYLDDVVDGARLVELETDDVDLRSYVAAPEVSLVAVIDGAMPEVDVQVRATALLNVGVTLRGACSHA